MKLFKRKNKVLDRLRSLEEHVGAVFVNKDDYSEHQADSEAWGKTLENRLKQVEEFVKETKKGKK